MNRLVWSYRLFVTVRPRYESLLVYQIAVGVLRGGPSVGQGTLNRFFAAHVLVLPLLTAILMLSHLQAGVIQWVGAIIPWWVSTPPYLWLFNPVMWRYLLTVSWWLCCPVHAPR